MQGGNVVSFVLMDRHEDFPPNRPPGKGADQELPLKFGLVPFNNSEWYGLYRGIILKDTKETTKEIVHSCTYQQ